MQNVCFGGLKKQKCMLRRRFYTSWSVIDRSTCPSAPSFKALHAAHITKQQNKDGHRNEDKQLRSKRKGIRIGHSVKKFTSTGDNTTISSRHVFFYPTYELLILTQKQTNQLINCCTRVMRMILAVMKRSSLAFGKTDSPSLVTPALSQNTAHVGIVFLVNVSLFPMLVSRFTNPPCDDVFILFPTHGCTTVVEMKDVPHFESLIAPSTTYVVRFGLSYSVVECSCHKTVTIKHCPNRIIRITGSTGCIAQGYGLINNLHGINSSPATGYFINQSAGILHHVKGAEIIRLGLLTFTYNQHSATYISNVIRSDRLKHNLGLHSVYVQLLRHTQSFVSG